MKMMPLKSIAGLTLLGLSALTQANDLTRFVSCPIYRDTDAGRKSGCWLANNPDNGVRYDITAAPTKPDWNYAMLVEGKVTEEGEQYCGGTIMDPVRVSVLDTPCPRHRLPAGDYPGRRFVLPERVVSPLSSDPEIPEGPFESRTFHIFFDLNSDFIIYQYGDYLLDQAITWLKTAKPEKIIVTGYAVTEPTQISGFEISEKADVAKRRAEKVKQALVTVGFPQDSVATAWELNPAPVNVEAADGIPTASRRRVEIRAEIAE